MKLTEARRNTRARALLEKIQECENECRAIGFTRASHAVNAAKNAIGWDFAEAVFEQEGSRTNER